MPGPKKLTEVEKAAAQEKETSKMLWRLARHSKRARAEIAKKTPRGRG